MILSTRHTEYTPTYKQPSPKGTSRTKPTASPTMGMVTSLSPQLSRRLPLVVAAAALVMASVPRLVVNGAFVRVVHELVLEEVGIGIRHLSLYSRWNAGSRAWTTTSAGESRACIGGQGDNIYDNIYVFIISTSGARTWKSVLVHTPPRIWNTLVEHTRGSSVQHGVLLRSTFQCFALNMT